MDRVRIAAHAWGVGVYLDGDDNTYMDYVYEHHELDKDHDDCDCDLSSNYNWIDDGGYVVKSCWRWLVDNNGKRKEQSLVSRELNLTAYK